MRWEDVAARLGLGPAHAAAWRGTWEQSSSSWEVAALPLLRDERLDEELARTGIPEGAHGAVRDATSAALANPSVGAVVRHLQWAIAGTGRPRPQPLLAAPHLPGSDVISEPAGRMLGAVVVLSLLDAGRERHRAQGVPDPVIDATFGELGAKVAEHHEVHGTWGFADLGWMTWHLAGELWHVGRLQHQASVRWQPLADETASNVPPMLGPVVDLHIPAGSPLDPDAVDRSLADFDALLRRIRPTLADAPLVCWSWLLDPQITDHVEPTSNLARFAARFEHVPLADAWDPRLRLFLYRVPDDVALDALPRETSLQRSIADHLAAGGSWQCALGVLRT